MPETFINKVAESGIISLDLEEFYPKEEILDFDLKEYLFMGLILKEKDFRNVLQSFNWEIFQNKYVAVNCSADAIIPMWAYMLVASYLQPIALDIVYGDKKTLINTIFIKKIGELNVEIYTDKRVVVKGCGDLQIPETAYLEITKKLRPYTKSIMSGEPCSTVPIFKMK